MLLLEDNKLDVEAIVRLIEIQNLDYDLKMVFTCSESRQCLSETNYDAALLDSHVPDASGLSILSDFGVCQPLLLQVKEMRELRFAL